MLAGYAEASGDRNPVHLDDQAAAAAGFPTVIVHGMLSMAFLADFVEANLRGTSLRVRRVKTRFRKVTLAGDVLRCEGRVKSRLDSGHFLLTFSAVNQNGDVTADGEAEVG